jgi:hypothetical protein
MRLEQKWSHRAKGFRPEAAPCRLLKKPSMAFSTSPTEKRGFQLALIFNGL